MTHLRGLHAIDLPRFLLDPCYLQSQNARLIPNWKIAGESSCLFDRDRYSGTFTSACTLMPLPTNTADPRSQVEPIAIAYEHRCATERVLLSVQPPDASEAGHAVMPEFSSEPGIRLSRSARLEAVAVLI